MKAGFNGLKEGFKQKFSRWMFGGNKDLPIDHGTGRLLIVLLAIITPVLLIPTLIGFGLKSVIVGYMIDSKDIILFIILLIVLTYISYKIQYFIIQYMGDVIIYVSSNEVNSFWKIRDDIKQIGLNLAKIVYGAVNNDHTHLSKKLKNKFDPHFLYSKITIVGHSLGSVIAYDTLNAIINQDKLDSGARNVVERTEALITFGSPMDKVAFLFRQMAKDALAREMLAAAHQPMILSYENRPKWWINIFCKVDIISGSLEYFDDPKSTVQQQRSVRNYRDLYNNWLRPVNAHTGYWKRSPTKKILYLAATSSLDTLDENSFRYVKIRKI